ncbi:MAG: DUF4905 domain-containing protein [Chryseolinea sp.]
MITIVELLCIKLMDKPLTRSIQFNFSREFQGTIWNTVLVPGKDILLLEIRSALEKRVTFSAVNSKTGEFLWHNISFEEPWWISLNGASDGTALFTIYTETNNPDRKGIFGYDVAQQKITWWNNDFSLITIGEHAVKGIATKYGTREIVLDVSNGCEISGSELVQVADNVVRPFQYAKDQPYFSTVEIFLTSRFNFSPVAALEYLEYESIILISFYIGRGDELSNELLILSEEGEMLMHEKIDERLKGIGLDTFFIYEGCVFFVKNKRGLFSYKIV